MNRAPVSAIVRVVPGMDDNGLAFIVASDKAEAHLPGMNRRVEIPLYVDLDAIEDPEVREAVEAWLR